MIQISTRRKLLVGSTLFLPSSVKIFVYQMMGADIGRKVRIGHGSYIFAGSIVMKDGAVIGSNVKIICKELVLDEESVIANDVVIVGEGILKLGKGCYIGPRAVIDATESVVLEDDVGMGGDIYTHGVWPPYTKGYPRKIAPVTIKRGAWVPPNTTILPGVTIGEEAIIGTGALVNKSIPTRKFAVGVPAKVKGSVDEIQVKLSQTEFNRRIEQMLSEFASWAKEAISIEENVEVKGYKFRFVMIRKTLFTTKKCAVYYANEEITARVIDSLFSLGKSFEKMILVATKGIGQDALKRIKENEALYDFFEWLDLKNYVCKRSWGYFFHLLRHYFRSHAGVRFRFDSALLN